MSTLVDAMRSMDVSHSPDSLISHPRFPYHVPPARVLVRFPFRFMCSLTCTNMFCRLVYLRFLLMPFSFCLVDSSLCLLLLLTLTCYSLSTRLTTRYSWTMTRLWLVSLLWTFVIVSRSSLYIWLEMRTCSPSSIYFETTLKVWPARSQVLSLVLSRSLAKATASQILRTCPLSTRLPVVKSGLCVYFGTLITICFSKFCNHLMYCNGLINRDVQEWCRLRWLGPRKGQEAETSAHVFSNFFWELVVAG